MIDILVQEPDMLVIAHDVEDLGHLIKVSVDGRTGLVDATDAEGETHRIGELTPSMLARIGGIRITKVAALDGMELLLPYACEFHLA